MDKLAELERRVTALEANKGGSIRFGEVTEVDEKTGTVRVKLPDAENLVTMPLRVSQRRTLKDQSQELPDVNEHVICAFTGQGLEQGAVIGAVYSQKDQSPGRPARNFYLKFNDGTEIEYDPEGHQMTARVKGSADVEADKDINVKSATVLNLQGAEQINLATPNLSIGGLAGGSCETVIAANLRQRGEYEHTGDYRQAGNHDLTGDVKAGGTVIDSGGNTNHHRH
jgi:phage baseplate assembly protein V